LFLRFQEETEARRRRDDMDERRQQMGHMNMGAPGSSVLQCVAACCSVLQRVAAARRHGRATAADGTYEHGCTR